jgi:hypothetical protein
VLFLGGGVLSASFALPPTCGVSSIGGATADVRGAETSGGAEPGACGVSSIGGATADVRGAETSGGAEPGACGCGTGAAGIDAFREVADTGGSVTLIEAEGAVFTGRSATQVDKDAGAVAVSGSGPSFDAGDAPAATGRVPSTMISILPSWVFVMKL